MVVLRERLGKELKRGPIVPDPSGGTAAIGGWGKFGNVLEQLLKWLFADLAQTIGWSQENAEKDVGLRGRPTLGDLSKGTRDLARRLGDKEPSPGAKLLVTDSNADSGLLRRLIDTRNATLHVGKKLPSKAELTSQLTKAM